MKRNRAFAQRDQAWFCTGLRVLSPLKTLHPRKHKVDERDQEEQDPNGENLGIADITGRINKISEREGDPMDRFASLAPDPEPQASNSEVGRLLEEAVGKLPDAYRTIFILRTSRT